MITLEQLLTLSGATLAVATEVTGATGDQREHITGYQGLLDLDVIEAPAGERIHLRDNQVVLVYVGSTAVPDGLTSDTLRTAVGSNGEFLPSRQGKLAVLHVVADRGVAWSEVDGVIGYVELFPPTTFAAYRREIYLQPPVFIQ